MSFAWKMCLLALALTAGGCVARPTVLEADYVLENVNVVPMNEEVVLPRRTVVVRDGTITAILGEASTVDVVSGERIDGGGKYLVPGLADMHVHMRMDPQAMFNLLLANGVTTVTNMRLGDGDGDVDHLELRAAVKDGRMVGPRYLVSGPQLKPDLLPDATAVEEMLDQHVEQGYDVVKIHQDLRLEIYNALIHGATQRGLKVTGHFQHQMPLSESLRMTSVEHAEEFLYTSREGFGAIAGDFHEFMPTYYAHVGQLADQNYRSPIVEDVAQSGIYVDPTLIIYKMISVWADAGRLADLATDEKLKYVPDGTRNWYLDPTTNPYSKEDFPLTPEHLEFNFHTLGRIVVDLHRAGVPLLLGTDTFGTLVPGYSVHSELELLVAAGLTPYEALRTGTVNVAAYLDESERAGTVEVGKRADLVLMEKNPLEDIRNTRDVRGVLTHNQWFARDELAEMLQEAAALSAGAN